MPPVHRATTFDCPHCGATTMQEWPNDIFLQMPRLPGPGMSSWDDVDLSICIACAGESIWLKEEIGQDESAWRMLWPATGGEPAHERLPAELLSLYNEARAVAPGCESHRFEACF